MTATASHTSMHTLTDIRVLATRLGISPGELLRMAREAQQDGSMPSLAHLHTHAREQLYHELCELQLENVEAWQVRFVRITNHANR